MPYQVYAAALLVTLLAGCVPTPPTADNQSATPAPAATPVDSAAAANPPMERVAAKAGVGKKGQSLKNETGIVVEPAKQLIKFEQRSVFDFQIKPALESYRGSTGSYPKTHEEFMEKIISANGIKLPTLPEGQTYVFDPESGQLMVERPQQ